MILENLLMAEKTVKENIKLNLRMLESIKSIRKLLRQIDFSSEVLPIEDKEKLQRLLISLKGDSLTRDEVALVDELKNIQNKAFDIGKLVNEYHTN